MSSLFRKPTFLTLSACGAVLSAFSAGVRAADAYFVPEVEVGAEHQTNPELLTANASSTDGYTASAMGTFGMRTPRSTTELRPRVEYENFLHHSELSHTNGYLDLNSLYNSPRSNWQLVASYSRENSYEAEQTSATYDKFDPNNPIVDSTGRIRFISDTTTRLQVRPGFSYRLSERLAAAFAAIYQAVNGDAEHGGSIVDYKYYDVDGSLVWSTSQRSQLGVGAYSSRFKTDDDSNTTTGNGVRLQLTQNWSPTFSGTESLNLERTKIDYLGTGIDSTATSWAADIGVVRSTELSSLRFNAGRTFSPSGAGVRNTLDQLRAEYGKTFKPRWSYVVALRAFRNRAQGSTRNIDNRDYATADLFINWEMTRNWYVSGGYSHFWQKYIAETDSSSNHVVRVAIGYKGLRPR